MNVYELRRLGKKRMEEYNGTDHYKSHTGKEEPIDTIFADGIGEDFCLGNIYKYSRRYSRTGNPLDLIKIIDYATILLGEVDDEREEGEEDTEATDVWGTDKWECTGATVLTEPTDRRNKKCCGESTYGIPNNEEGS